MYINQLKLVTKQFTHIHFFSLILYLLPLFLVIGPAIADISISILAIYAIFVTFFFKKWKLHYTKLSAIIFIFNIIILLSSSISISPNLSFHSSLFYLRFYFFFIAIVYLINENKNFIRLFFWFFSILLILIILDGFYQFYFGLNILGNPLINNRVSGFFGSELKLGSYLSRLTPIYFSLLYVLYSKKNYFDQINILSLLLFFIIILLSGERVSIFINIIFSAVYLIFLYSSKIKKITFSFFAILLIFLAVLFINNELRTRILNLSYSQVFLSSSNDHVLTNSPIIRSRNIYISNKNENYTNNKYDDLRINTVLENCINTHSPCLNEKDLINLHNLLYAFNKDNFNIGDHLIENVNVNIRDIHQIYVNFKIEKYNKFKIQSFIDSTDRAIQDKYINFNLQDESQPYQNIKNFHSISSLLNIDILNYAHSENLDKIFFINKKNKLIFISPEHDSMIRTALNIFKDHLFFGSGPRMYRYLCQFPSYAVNNYSVNYTSCSTSPHNIYIQALAETGLIGFVLIGICFCFCFYYLSLSFYKKLKKDKVSIYHFNLILICFLNLLPFIPTGNFFGNWISIIFYLPLGFLMYKDEQKIKYVK